MNLKYREILMKQLKWRNRKVFGQKVDSSFYVNMISKLC